MTFAYTDEHITWLRENFPKKPITQLTQEFNKHFSLDKTKVQLHSFMKRKGIKSGRTGRFEKGHGPTYLNGKRNKTSFKKGHAPLNRLPVGSERIDAKDGYILIKVNEPNPYNGQPTRYRHKHHVVWEKRNGAIPKGMIVSFIDGNKMNCSIENLELITRAESLYRNRHGYNELPDELKPNMRALAKLETARFKVEKELN